MDILTLLLRLSVSMVLGGTVGLERQSKHRPAGFRTHILVCTGASLIMCLTEYMAVDYGARFGVTPDPFRLGAQVISGIGFLGAGTIINFGTSVKGLTTAAGLWSVACIGLAAGAGFYEGAVLTTVLIMITLFLFTRISYKLDEHYQVLDIIIETVNKPEVIGEISFLLGSRSIKINEQEFTNLSETGNRTFRMSLSLARNTDIFALMDSISGIGGVARVEKI